MGDGDGRRHVPLSKWCVYELKPVLRQAHLVGTRAFGMEVGLQACYNKKWVCANAACPCMPVAQQLA